MKRVNLSYYLQNKDLFKTFASKEFIKEWFDCQECTKRHLEFGEK